MRITFCANTVSGREHVKHARAVHLYKPHFKAGRSTSDLWNVSQNNMTANWVGFNYSTHPQNRPLPLVILLLTTRTAQFSQGIQQSDMRRQAVLYLTIRATKLSTRIGLLYCKNVASYRKMCKVIGYNSWARAIGVRHKRTPA